MEDNKQQNDFGALSGIIIVIILLLVGAFYFGKQRIEQNKEYKASLEAATSPTSSDEISDIEKDANSINIDNLGMGINNL